jgi:hypothetical protein
MLLMPHRKESSASTIFTGKQSKIASGQWMSRATYCPLDRFTAIIRDQWPRTDFGYHRVDVQGQSDRGWTDYMLKRRQKDSLLGSIDWVKCHLDC